MTSQEVSPGPGGAVADKTPEEWLHHIWTHTQSINPKERRPLYALLGIEMKTGAAAPAVPLPLVARGEKVSPKVMEMRMQAVIKKHPEVRRALEELARLAEEAPAEDEEEDGAENGES